MTKNERRDRRIEVYQKQGWCPVKWSHHPPEIKNEIRRMRMVPQMKQCFYNCQRFVVNTFLSVEYHEGWVTSIIPIEHAWIKWNGQIIDLTLEPDMEREYLKSIAYTAEDIRINMIRTKQWTTIDPRALQEIGPYAEGWKRMGVL